MSSRALGAASRAVGRTPRVLHALVTVTERIRYQTCTLFPFCAFCVLCGGLDGAGTQMLPDRQAK